MSLRQVIKGVKGVTDNKSSTVQLYRLVIRATASLSTVSSITNII